MPDLDAAIRDRLNGVGLDGFENSPCNSNEGCTVHGFDEMRDALLAVLDLHKAIRISPGIRLADPPRFECSECRETRAGFEVAAQYPCPTVCAIAEKLGISPLT